MRRFVSIWLPHWPTDRWRRRHSLDRETPLALVAPLAGALRVQALDQAAAMRGVGPGLALAEARARVPDLAVANHDPADDLDALGRLADWCARFSPWCATDGEDGLLLDVSGVAHLFGGEAGLLAALADALGGLALDHRAALADTPAAAWAWARHGGGGLLIAGHAMREVLRPLPAAALRLPAAMLGELAMLGLRTIADLDRLPRAPLARRFGPLPGRRLDLLWGDLREPVSPRRPPAARRVRMSFAEPIGRPEDIDAALARLTRELCRLAAAEGQGLRRVEAICFRVDGETARIDAGLSRPTRDADHVHRLLAGRIERIDPGFGIETILLEATECNPLPAEQAGVDATAGAARELGLLLDRLQGRLGPGQVVRLAAQDSHWPERAMRLLPAEAPSGAGDAHGQTSSGAERPLLLLAAPELIETDGGDEARPPAAFRWRRVRRHIVRCCGPERIEPEWWRRDTARRARDYWRFEDAAGRRFWVYRDGPRWYLHGLFG